MLTVTVIQVVLTLTAFVGGFSKLAKASLPFWSYFPPILQRILPGAVLVAGALPGALIGVTDWVGLATALLGAVALALPGTHKYSNPLPPDSVEPTLPTGRLPAPPKTPSGLPLIALAFILSVAVGFVGATACSYHPNYPATLACVEPLADGALRDVSAALLRGGSVSDALTELTKTYAPSVVECAVQQFVNDISTSHAMSRQEIEAVKAGRAFLQSTGTRFE